MYDPNSKSDLKKSDLKKSGDERLHDLKTVYSDFKALVHLLSSGYRFDGEHGALALTQLEKALGMLNEEILIQEQEIDHSLYGKRES